MTLWNHTLDNIHDIYNNNNDIIRYICAGAEVCPSTKRAHLQCWIQFHNKKRMGCLKKIFGKQNKFLACKGDEYDNDKYCAKDGNYIKFGKFVCQGQRTDLELLKREVMNGMNKKTIIKEHFETYCKYRNGINDLCAVIEKEQRSEFRHVEVILLHGTTNTGKTRKAMEEAKFKIDASELQWWDGYEGEHTILIDEYDNDVKITKMLNILDGYMLRLPIKGGFTYANWRKVYITTNLSPDQLHSKAKPRHRDAFFRRITKIIDMNKNVPKWSKGNTITLDQNNYDNDDDESYFD